MAVVTGPIWVPAPNPVVPRYGLFRAATGPLDLPIYGRSGGVIYDLTTCDLPLGYEVNCQESHAQKTLTSSVPSVSGAPFVVYSAVTCSTVGFVNWGQERIRKFLYDQLTAGEQATVERILSTGAFGQAPSLGGNPDVVNLGSAQGPVRAVAMLEDWLYAQYGLPGVIHAPIFSGAYLKGAHLIELDGNPGSGVWRTELGTAVSIGNYAGTGPTGNVPATGSTWMYITGQTAVWRTPDAQLLVPPMDQLIDRATNTISTIMEREYVVTFDCYVAAVEVTLDTTDQ